MKKTQNIEKNKFIKNIKSNITLLAIVIAYLIMFIIRPDMGRTAIKNTAYYLKEMLMIMPVIFILTALLDTWVPKKTIMKSLGKQAKWKGTMLSFVLGAISAGPIYAAFPFCVMLHKKGASVRNIIIILSSWAVIKLPMLFNEVKFLGFKFMAARWVLTVIAIIIFSWIASRIVKDEDIPKDKHENKQQIGINKEGCLGCGLCASKYPELFEITNGKAVVKKYNINDINEEKLKSTISNCPTNVISYAKEDAVQAEQVSDEAMLYAKDNIGQDVSEIGNTLLEESTLELDNK